MTDQVQQAPELTPEQQAQQAQMQAAMRQQQEQVQNHINQEVQKGVQLYNLDVQRLTIVAQGVEAIHNVEKNAPSKEMSAFCLALRTKFEDAIGIHVTHKVSHETSAVTSEVTA